MYFLMYVTIAISIYVGTFNKDFKEEDVAKSLTFLVICMILVIAVSIISSL